MGDGWDATGLDMTFLERMLVLSPVNYFRILQELLTLLYRLKQLLLNLSMITSFFELFVHERTSSRLLAQLFFFINHSLEDTPNLKIQPLTFDDVNVLTKKVIFHLFCHLQQFFNSLGDHPFLMAKIRSFLFRAAMIWWWHWYEWPW